MKTILTKPEKERLLEQFKKSGKTHAQFAEENGLNVKTLSKWIYEWHHQIKTINEVKLVEIKTTAISSVNDIRIKKSGMEILIPADLEQYQLKNIPTVLASKGQHHRLSSTYAIQTGVSVLFSDVIFGYLSRDYIIFSFYSLCRIGHCMHTSHESKFIPS
ncbi:hypothetical protein [uncultured Treponema sp.]|uniref:IS66 family insertion sequence element accessory protein TnpA n=1 Tax=uncultured Treponema sp. TaxID=162155 RepID=UPI002594EC17|nr:hypothetical protein [uncultured Treponema sp.]